MQNKRTVYRRELIACLLSGMALLTACAQHTPRGGHWAVEQLNPYPLELGEGPAWDGAHSVFFTEIYASRIQRFDLASGAVTTVFPESAAANGMVLDAGGQLWICAQDVGQIVRLLPGEKSWTVVAGEYQGTRFNHPNDLTLDAFGGVYFTDPAWNPALHQHQPVNGVYYVNDGTDGERKVSLLISDMDKPNGILLSRDNRFLYVVDMGNDDFRRYPVVAPGKLGPMEHFAELSTYHVRAAAPDGLEEDLAGNIYVAAENGIQIFSASGELLNLVQLPQRPTNLEFIDPERQVLFVTTMNNLYRVSVGK